LLDGGDNVGVGAAAADVAAHEFADLVRSFRLALGDQPGRRADLPRRAIPALESVVVDERLLQRMQRAVDSEPFDRGDLGAVPLAEYPESSSRSAARRSDATNIQTLFVKHPEWQAAFDHNVAAGSSR
jgi:hypothetical protein